MTYTRMSLANQELKLRRWALQNGPFERTPLYKIMLEAGFFFTEMLGTR